MKQSIFVLLFILAGCADPPPYKWYKYHLAITTGLAESIESDGGPIYIEFSEGSDKKHLFSFSMLNQDIAISGNEIQIYGRLLPEIHHTPSGGHTENGETVVYATSEPFQYFELKNWSVKVPIRIARYDNDDLKLIVEEKPGLTKENFDGPIHTDPKVYEVK